MVLFCMTLRAVSFPLPQDKDTVSHPEIFLAFGTNCGIDVQHCVVPFLKLHMASYLLLSHAVDCQYEYIAIITQDTDDTRSCCCDREHVADNSDVSFIMCNFLLAQSYERFFPDQMYTTDDWAVSCYHCSSSHGLCLVAEYLDSG